jgi:hypothetical protein
MNIIATPDQISARDRQQATMKIQAKNLLTNLEQRIQVAIDRGDRCLIAQLQIEQEFLFKQL